MKLSSWLIIGLILCVVGGCGGLYKRLLGGGPKPQYKVKVWYTGGGEYPIVFKILTSHKFGPAPRGELKGFTVDKIIQLSESGDEILKGEEVWAVWVKQLSYASRRIEIIAYGVNPAPDLFREEIKPKPLELEVLYRAGYLTTFTYFKLIKNSDLGVGFIVLQGKSPDNLRKER